MPTRLVVFDLDGTLVDSAPATVELLNQLRTELGFKHLPYDVFIPWLSLGGPQLLSNSLELKSNKEALVYLNEFRIRAKELPSGKIPTFEEVDLLLKSLYNCNIKLAICTNKARGLVEKLLEELKIKSYFDLIVAGDDLSTSKPDPAMLLECCNKLGVEISDTLFVGDSTVDQKTASNAGIRFAFFQKGYNDGVDESTTAINFNRHLDLSDKIFRHE